MQKAPQSSEPAGHDISTLLRAWSGGDQTALERLTPVVYDELHRLARRYMKGERPGHSLQTTALVNDACTRLVDYKRMHWQDHAHFFAVSAQDAMNTLAQLDPRKVQVVEMRFFGGLSVDETAEVLEVSTVTVKRDWRAARTWLYRELTGAINGPRTLETSR
jgi:RNA polymerase sigma-70 factor (ECF subfamily)